MTHWVLNRLISFVLDTAAVCEAASAVAGDREISRRLSTLCADGLATARELADLQRREGAKPVMTGTPQGTARCHAVLQLANVSTKASPAAVATAIRAVTEAVQGCERLARLDVPPQVASAIHLVHGDLRVDRVELDQLMLRLRRVAARAKRREGPGERLDAERR